MSWAYGVISLRDGSEIEAGYSVVSKCDQADCSTQINRGLAYRCGGYNFDEGCGHYFCSEHLFWALNLGAPQLCQTCLAAS